MARLRTLRNTAAWIRGVSWRRRVAELNPLLKEHRAPIGLRFGSHHQPEQTAARVARILAPTSSGGRDPGVLTPELITITPEAAGGSLVTVELTTHPQHLTVTLTAIGLTLLRADIPASPGDDDG